ncbi:chromosome partitioning protein ParB [bacterium]|nr:chromosome partitioning protein ParB [bacterium]
MKVINLPITNIKPYWRNPRNNEKAVDAVKESITKYGFNSPIVIDKDNVIIAGHTRYKALVQLGWEEVPCVIAEIDAEKAKEYRIADNKTSELAVWDMDLLIPELREITDIQSLDAFFPQVDLKAWLQDTGGAGSSKFDNPTTESIEALEGKMNTQFEDKSKRTEYVEAICPHCAEIFYLNREDLLNQAPVAHD